MQNPMNRFKMIRDINIYIGKQKLASMLMWGIKKITSGLYISITATIFYIVNNFNNLFSLEGIIPVIIAYSINLINYMIALADKKEIEVLKHGDDLTNIKINSIYRQNEYEIQIHNIEKGNKINKNISRQYYMNSQKINNILISLDEKNEDISLFREKTYEDELRKDIKSKWNQLSMLLKWKYDESIKSNKLFKNEKKLCLTESLLENRLLQSKKIGIHKGDYYTNYITNILSGRTVVDKISGKKISNTVTDMFPKNIDNEMLNLEDSKMCNEIGISTIVIYMDKHGNYHIPFPRQNSRNQVGSGLIISSATGGADFSDITKDALLGSIKYSMERELHEELYKHVEINKFKSNVYTVVTGFHRWINHGGKPEFTGVTFLYGDHLFNPASAELEKDTIVLAPSDKFDIKNTLISFIKKHEDISLSGYRAIENLVSFIEKHEQYFLSKLPEPQN